MLQLSCRGFQNQPNARPQEPQWPLQQVRPRQSQRPRRTLPRSVRSPFWPVFFSHDKAARGPFHSSYVPFSSNCCFCRGCSPCTLDTGCLGGRCLLLTGARNVQFPRRLSFRISRSFCAPVSNGTSGNNRLSVGKPDPIAYRSKPYRLIWSLFVLCRATGQGENYSIWRQVSHTLRKIFMATFVNNPRPSRDSALGLV